MREAGFQQGMGRDPSSSQRRTDKGMTVNNLTYGNPSGGYRLQGNVQTGGISADPKFVNYDAFGTGDYHLQGSSSAIDRASARYAPSNDLDGNHRPMGAGPDIGAYEFQM